MKKLNKVLKIGALAAFFALVIAPMAFASVSDCVGPSKKYPNLSTSSTGYPVKCTPFTDGDKTVQLYGKSSADCAQAASLASDPEGCTGDDLNGIIKTIINTLIFIIGMVAVIMIILGGISYATSQGDPAKVKKGKDTILYGIIGVIVALLAFAIVNFVIGALSN